MHAYIRTYILTYLHTHTHMYIRMYKHTYMNTCMHAYTQDSLVRTLILRCWGDVPTMRPSAKDVVDQLRNQALPVCVLRIECYLGSKKTKQTFLV
jgi:hypothetical protein